MTELRTSIISVNRWSFHGFFLANNTRIRPDKILIIFDPTVPGVDMPEEYIVDIYSRYMAANGPGSMGKDPSGSSISVACHANGRMINPLDLSIELPSGQVRITGQALAGPPKFSRVYSRYMCETSLRVVQSQSGSEILIGRAVLEALDSVLLDAQTFEIVFRQSAVVAPKPGRPGLQLTPPATYSGAHALVPAGDGVNLFLFPADPSDGCKYMLESRTPKQGCPTGLLFEFSAVGAGCRRDPTLEELPGIFHLIDGMQLHEDAASRGAILRLQCSFRSDIPSYKVSIVSSQENILVTLEPVPVRSELEALAVETDTSDPATLEDVSCGMRQEALVTRSDPPLSKPYESASAVDQTVSAVTA
jgi:hypothetical protein